MATADLKDKLLKQVLQEYLNQMRKTKPKEAKLENREANILKMVPHLVQMTVNQIKYKRSKISINK